MAETWVIVHGVTVLLRRLQLWHAARTVAWTVGAVPGTVMVVRS